MRHERLFAFGVGALFTVSGFSALIYQAVFNKVFSFVFGVSGYAAATVLATFMLGLALGSYVFGRLSAGRLRRLLVWYGVVELAIGLYALFFLQISEGVEHWYVPLAREAKLSLQSLTAIRFVSALILVGIPTTLMGSSLPLLVEAARRRGLKRSVNLFYALNVAGATVGTVIAAYLLLPRWHLDGTLLLIFVLNLIVFVGSLACELLAPEVSKPHASPEEPSAPNTGGTPESKAVPHWLAALGFASGFLTFSNEVYWFHLLGLTVGTSTYAYAIMLFTTLLGMTAGGLLVKSWLARGVSPNGLLLVANLGLAASTLACIPLWDSVPALFLQLGLFAKSFEARELTRFVVSSLLIFPAALCSGLTFPILLHRVEAGSKTPGAAVGALNAVNTAGTVAGSLLGGFVLLRLLGGRNALLLSALLAILLVAALTELQARRRLAVLIPAVVCWAFVAAALPSWDAKKLLSGANIYFEQAHDEFDELVWQHEDYVGGVTSVVRSGKKLTLLTNGKFQGNNGNEVKDQRRLALLPNLFVENPRRALNIGLGTACTLHVIERFPYEHVDAVELSADIVHAARTYFSDINENVLDSKRVTVHINDGRNFLQLHDPTQPFDLISIELNSIWFAGAGNLYSDEFYTLAKANMAPGGVMQQWVQLHHIDAKDLAVIMATLRKHFAFVQLWLPGHQGILVASDQPLVVREDRLRVLSAAFPPSDFFMGEPRTVLGELLLTSSQVDRFLAANRSRLPVPLSTDRNLYLEYSTPRGNVLGWNYDENFHALLPYSQPAFDELLPRDFPRREETVTLGLLGRANFHPRYSLEWHEAIASALSKVPSADQRLGLKAQLLDSLNLSGAPVPHSLQGGSK